MTTVLSRDAELSLCSLGLKHTVVFRSASDTQERRKLDFTDALKLP